MAVAQIQMYELLKGKFSEREAELFVQLIDEKMDIKLDQRKHELATKEDISLLKDNTSRLRAELMKDMSMLRAEFKEDMSVLRAEFKEDISIMRGELLKTIYLTSMGQLIAIIASVVSLILVLKK